MASKEIEQVVADAIGKLVEGMVELVVLRLSAVVAEITAPTPPARAQRAAQKVSRPRKGLDMTCRVPGCGKRSRGPRFLYMCAEHSHLPIDEKRKHVEAYRHGKGAH